jgi:hypothetical protein
MNLPMSDHAVLAARFAAMDAENPEVWRLFEAFTFHMIGRGFRHYSADAVLHRVRWETAMSVDDGSGYKISNVWSAWYARKFHRTHPEHFGFFRNRQSQADPAIW